MDFYLQKTRFRTDFAVNAKSCVNSNFILSVPALGFDLGKNISHFLNYNIPIKIIQYIGI